MAWVSVAERQRNTELDGGREWLATVGAVVLGVVVLYLAVTL